MANTEKQNEDIDWDAEFADDPDYQALTPEQRDRLLEVMEKMLAMGMAAVYGDEAPDEPDADMDCRACLAECQAKCCTYVFALTKEEVARGNIQYNQQKPYFIARDGDGYCPHLNRQSLQCEVWETRPLRCRRYHCKDDREIWPMGFPYEDK